VLKMRARDFGVHPAPPRECSERISATDFSLRADVFRFGEVLAAAIDIRGTPSISGRCSRQLWLWASDVSEALVGYDDLAQKGLVGDALLASGGAKPVLGAPALGGQMPHDGEGLFRLSGGAIVDEGSDGIRMRSGHRLSFSCKQKGRPAGTSAVRDAFQSFDKEDQAIFSIAAEALPVRRSACTS
jgi:hypothetical protein